MADPAGYYGNPDSAFNLNPSTPLAQLLATLGFGGQPASSQLPAGMYSGPSGGVPISASIDPALTMTPGTAQFHRSVENAITPALSFAPGALMPIRAYHGSPYDFTNFSAEKIGSGEGAQAYGHGLYFSENPEVAHSYRDKLTANISDALTPEGAASRAMGLHNGDVDKALDWLDQNIRDIRNSAAAMARNGRQAPDVFLQRIENEYEPAKALIKGGYTGAGRGYEVNIHADPEMMLDWDKPLSEHSPEVQRRVQEIAARYPNGAPPARSMDWGEFDSKYRRPLGDVLNGVGPLAADQATARNIAELRLNKGADKGFMLEDYLREFSPDKLPAAQKILQAYDKQVSPVNAPGSEWYRSLVNAVEEHPGLSLRQAAGIPLSEAKDSSQLLNEAGIPGIRYLDQGSRDVWQLINKNGEWGLHNPNTGNDWLHSFANKDDALAQAAKLNARARTHNYVVFDPATIEIIRKYGIAALLGGGAGAAALTQGNQAQAGQ